MEKRDSIKKCNKVSSIDYLIMKFSDFCTVTTQLFNKATIQQKPQFNKGTNSTSDSLTI